MRFLRCLVAAALAASAPLVSPVLSLLAAQTGTPPASTARLHAGVEGAASLPPVYRLDFPTFRTGDYGNWSATLVPRPGGTSGLQITGVHDGWHTCLFRPEGTLKGGQDYTAELTYEIVEPTIHPGTFYMFARSKTLGQAADLWKNWTGEKGEKATVRLPLTLRDASDWTFTVGMRGPGTIIVDDFRIVSGSGRVVVPAVLGKTAPKATALPAGTKLPTGPEAFVIEPPAAGKGTTLVANDFGLTADGKTPPADPNEVGQKNFAALTSALAACKAQKASRLVVKPGVYRFASDDSIKIENFSDFTFDGGQSEFIFEKMHTGKAAILLGANERCVFKNLIVDWDWNVAPLATLSRVTALSPDNKTVDLVFPDGDAASVERLNTLPWLEFWPINPDTFQPILGPKIWIPKKQVEQTGPNTLRVSLSEALPLVVGTSYNIRHYSYEMNAFRLANNHHVQMENVTIYSIPGMGWLSNGTQDHWGFKNCKIVLRPNTRRPLAAAADGFHSYESQGFLLMDGCEISHCGDDCVNIHDNCGSGLQRIDDHTLFAPNIENWRATFATGDEVELCNPDYSPTGFVSRLTAYKRDGSKATLTFAKELPATIPMNSIVWSHRYNTKNVRIVNSTFHNSGGRGMLLAAHGALVEGCTFSHLFGGAFQFHTEILPGWSEGHGASNVVFRSNTVDTVSLREVFAGASVYATAVLPFGPTPYPLFHDLLIENNRFTNCDGAALQLSSCRSVIARNNTIATTAPLPNASPLRALISVERASDMTLGGNLWYASPFIAQPGVSMDPQTTKNVKAEGNVIFKGPPAPH